ncbi:MAG: hypothetical protein QOI52_185, partial [Chloroflexota bacterium]|nr:hypothetical protein [Chloroflexota bacterium]
MAPARVATARVVTGPAPTGHAAMARPARGVVDLAAVLVPAARGADPGSTVRARSTVRGVTAPSVTGPGVTAPSAMVPMLTARGRSSPVPRDRVAPTIAGALPDHDPTAVGRVGRAGGARVPGPNAAALVPTGQVRGPDRAIDSDRVRGSAHGRIGAPTIAMIGHATSPGAPRIGGPGPAEAS